MDAAKQKRESVLKRLHKYFFSRKSVSEIITRIIVWCIFAAFALSYLYVFFWGLTASLKTHNDLILNPFKLPKKWMLGNYLEVFSLLNVEGYGFLGMLFNSLYFSVFGSFITCMSTCMLAYVTCKYKFPGARWYFVAVTIMITLPLYGSGGSMYRLMFNMGMINSRTQLILAVAGMNMYYLYFYAAYQSLSWSYAEAAFIDGANDYKVFFKVMFPQVLNLFGALYLLTWVGDWNNFGSALIYLPKLPTLAGGIYLFELTVRYHARMDILYTAYMISAVPPLLLFAFFNRALTSNISLGGIKE